MLDAGTLFAEQVAASPRAAVDPADVDVLRGFGTRHQAPATGPA
jgi:hypothetical protein